VTEPTKPTEEKKEGERIQLPVYVSKRIRGQLPRCTVGDHPIAEGSKFIELGTKTSGDERRILLPGEKAPRAVVSVFLCSKCIFVLAAGLREEEYHTLMTSVGKTVHFGGGGESA